MGLPIPKILVIAVNYEADEAALKFISDLGQQDMQAIIVDVILVDNTERLNSKKLFQKLQTAYANVRCLKSPSNLGYFGGAKYALNTYLKNQSMPEWVMVTNVDLEFVGKNFFTNISHLYQHNTNQIGVIAPSIWSSRFLRELNPLMNVRPSALRMHGYRWIYRYYSIFTIHQWAARVKYQLSAFFHAKLSQISNEPKNEGCRYFNEPKSCNPNNATEYIYAPHGACIIFSRDYFLKGGNLNYPCFLFGEEIYVAETARQIGLKIAYLPGLKMAHDDHISTGIVRSRKMAGYILQSTIYIANTYFPF